MRDPGRSPRHTADVDWRETENDALRQEIAADRAWLAAQDPVPHGALSAEALRHKRQWCRVQRWRAAQQRRRGEDSA